MGGNPPGPRVRQGAPRHEAVDMDVRVQALIPRVQNHDAAELPAEVAVTELAQRLAGRGEQQGYEQPFVP